MNGAYLNSFINRQLEWFVEIRQDRNSNPFNFECFSSTSPKGRFPGRETFFRCAHGSRPASLKSYLRGTRGCSSSIKRIGRVASTFHGAGRTIKSSDSGWLYLGHKFARSCADLCVRRKCTAPKFPRNSFPKTSRIYVRQYRKLIRAR